MKDEDDLDDQDAFDDDEATDADFADSESPLPACPFCGDAEGACDHVFAVIAGGDELLGTIPEYGELDDLVLDIQRMTLGGEAALEELARRKDSWWLKPRGAGFGHSGRMAGAEFAAERLGLTVLPASDGEQAVHFAEDPGVARERLKTALQRVKRDLTVLARRLGHEP